MATVKEIYQSIDAWAPFATQMDFDNSGFLVGRGNAEVNKVLVALDITRTVIEEAEELGAQLIVAHHPVIFRPLKSLTDGDLTGANVLRMAEKGIAAICAHTNLDAAQGGVNCRLAQKLELTEIDHLHPDGVDEQGRTYGIGRVGNAHEAGLAAEEYARFVKEKLGTSSVRFVDCGKPVTKVAVGGGSCSDMMVDALKLGCDTFVTADVKYNFYLEAAQLGINLMDAGHYATENVVCAPMVEYLKEKFPDVTVLLSEKHREAYSGV